MSSDQFLPKANIDYLLSIKSFFNSRGTQVGIDTQSYIIKKKKLSLFNDLFLPYYDFFFFFFWVMVDGARLVVYHVGLLMWLNVQFNIIILIFVNILL